MATEARPADYAPLTRPGRNAESVLEVDGLQTYLFTRLGVVKAVDDVSFRGATRRDAGDRRRIRLRQDDDGAVADAPGARSAGPHRRRLDQARRHATWSRSTKPRCATIRGNEISMIFQEPMTSLNPVMTIGNADRRDHPPASGSVAGRRRCDKAVEMLRLVRIPEPAQRAREYPHQLSGGMRQRAMIAMALACNPRVLIADEPTTALDVTIQAQILDLILDLQKKLGTAVMLITHDLGVVAETAQRVIVMYAGRKVEEAEVEELFGAPLHPYTHGLLASIPQLAIIGRRGTAAAGERPAQGDPRHGAGADQPAAGLRLRAALRHSPTSAAGRRLSALRTEAPGPLGRLLAFRAAVWLRRPRRRDRRHGPATTARRCSKSSI